MLPPTATDVPLSVMSAAGPLSVGLAIVLLTVGQLAVQSLLPTSTQLPAEFLYQVRLSVVTATIA